MLRLFPRLMMKLTSIFTKPKDEFPWNIYDLHYRAELYDRAKQYTLKLDENQYTFDGLSVVQKDKTKLSLDETHRILYQTILRLEPPSILEAGCGGGDHLHNLKTLNPNLYLRGLDRSEKQLDLLEKRNPEFKNSVEIFDLISGILTMPPADLVFTQAVLMHITEAEDRAFKALKNILSLSISHVVLLENWVQKNFLDLALAATNDVDDWAGAQFYYTKSEYDPSLSCMIISKNQLLNFDRLHTYELLLEGRELWPVKKR
jgi:SAM-dependent methyltransferase